MEFTPISALLIPVTGEEDQDPAEVSEETLDEGEVSKETLDTGDGGDDGQELTAEELQQQLKEQEAARRKLEQDLNEMKSSFQRRDTETQKDYQTRIERLTRELDDVKTAGMDEVERTKYLLERKEEELRQERERRSTIESQLEEQRMLQEWNTHFSQAGIDMTAMPGETLNDKFQAAFFELLKKAQGATPTPDKGKKKPVTAPDVVTKGSKGTKAAKGIQDVIADHRKGNETDDQVLDRIYSQIQQGKMSPDVLLGAPPTN